MQKRLLVLAAGILQVPVIKKAKDMGIYVIAADGDANAVGLQYADKAVVVNITSEEDVLRVAREERIDGVIHPCSEVGLSGITKLQAIRATNKHLMREAFERGNAPSPKSFCFEDANKAWKCFCKELPKDGILKPSRNSGSRGIAKIQKGLSEVQFVELFNRAKEKSRDKSVMLEQFVEGPEFSVEIIAWNGEVNVLTVTDKKTTEAPYFVELGHNQPSCFPQYTVDSIKDAAVAGVKALGVMNCACHAEVKVQNGEASEEKHGVCIRYFCPKPGKLVSIQNTEVLDDSRVYLWEIYHKEGDMIPEVTSSLCRSGHVIVTEETPQKAIALAERLINEVKMETV